MGSSESAEIVSYMESVKNGEREDASTEVKRHPDVASKKELVAYPYN